MLKKIVYGLLVALIIIQFIRPQRNEATAASSNDVNTVFAMNDEVKAVFSKACNDCHSNTTTYPWYANIQPLGWWLQHHVNEGKEHLNLSEFASYTAKKQRHKLEEIGEAVTEGWMPLDSYKWIHKDAALTAAEAAAVKKWVDASMAQLPAASVNNQSDREQQQESH